MAGMEMVFWVRPSFRGLGRSSAKDERKEKYGQPEQGTDS